MSMHKIPLTPIEEAGLRAHGLGVGTPSQLSDAFRQGVRYARTQQSSQGGEAVEVPRVLGLDHPHCPRNPLIADGFRCGADWMRRQVLALGPLYTHPPTTPADSRVVPVELLKSWVTGLQCGIISQRRVLEDLRELLEVKS